MHNNTIIYFSHGKDSGPNGLKINYLTKVANRLKIKTESIDYRSAKNADERVKILLNRVNNSYKSIFLYGSSMGAYVSLVASKHINPKGMFLCAPALYLPNYKIQTFDNINFPTTITHGWQDTVVPVENSIKFSKRNQTELHLINDDHSLSSSEAIISMLFENFIVSKIN